jgi:hypothetical protein
MQKKWKIIKIPNIGTCGAIHTRANARASSLAFGGMDELKNTRIS